jgi:hypothetical protein
VKGHACAIVALVMPADDCAQNAGEHVETDPSAAAQ